MDDKTSHQHGSWFTEAAIIALAAPWAYLATWAYERGYARWFGVPDDLVRVELNLVILVGGSLLFLVPLIALVADGMTNVFTQFRKGKSWVGRALSLTLFLAMIGVTILTVVVGTASHCSWFHGFRLVACDVSTGKPISG